MPQAWPTCSRLWRCCHTRPSFFPPTLRPHDNLTTSNSQLSTSQAPTSSAHASSAAPLPLLTRRPVPVNEIDDSNVVTVGELVVDDATYTARIHGTPLDLTYKEFELLRFLVQHSGRVFTRKQLLQEVWGYDFFGGTRTVDVHVRRLRAKLGTEYEGMIATVRNVGYKAIDVDA